MKGIVSFSLFGDDPDDIYRGGALKNALLYSSGVYGPTIEMTSRFYVSPQTLGWAKENLSGIPRTEIQLVPEEEDFRATLWRYRALKSCFDFYLFRDTDSRPILREVEAVKEWLESGRTFHIMRDHPYHNVPIMAGLWGIRATKMLPYVRTMLMKARHRRSYYQVDQQFLRATIWRMVKSDCVSHVGCEWDYGEETTPFPSARADNHFVGAGYHADESPRFPEHHLILSDHVHPS